MGLLPLARQGKAGGRGRDLSAGEVQLVVELGAGAPVCPVSGTGRLGYQSAPSLSGLLAGDDGGNLRPGQPADGVDEEKRGAPAGESGGEQPAHYGPHLCGGGRSRGGRPGWLAPPGRGQSAGGPV